MTYHENHKRVHGPIVSGEEAKLILERADQMYVDDAFLQFDSEHVCSFEY
jgi:hypothetical protein